MNSVGNLGESHSSSKLTEEDIRLIRALREEGLSLKKIAEKFEVSWQNIQQIVNGKLWRHVK